MWKSNGKDMTILLIVGYGKANIILLIVELIKMIELHKMSFFPEPYTHSKNKIKF